MPLSQSALRILSAIVKASLRRAVGDPTLQAVAEELTTLGQEDLARRLDALLGHPDRRQALVAALERADACVQRRLQDTLPDLAPLADAGRGLPLRGLPAVLAALENLPADDLNEGRLRRAVLKVVRRDWQAATPQQAETVADAYLLCLREALLGVETDVLRTLGRAVLRTEQAVKRLEQALQAWKAQASRDIHIQGHVNRSVLVTGDHNVVQVFLNAAPFDHRTRVERFLQEYLGTSDAPVPFGGRKADLRLLSQWLEEDTKPYFFLHAPAGRGKSALLVRWATAVRRQAEDAWAVVFVPVSLRFDTHRPGVFLSLLACGLTRAYDPQQKCTERDPQILLSMAAGFLRQAKPPEGRRGVLVVLDGLDEAAWGSTGEAWRSLFPIAPPPHLKVIVSARLLANAELRAWLDRLGWRRGKTRTHRLTHLSLEGVREVLAQMQVPLDELSRDVDLVATLYRLTDEGDPLLVGLYARELLDALEAEGVDYARRRARQITDLVGSGYATFFEDYWWPEQKKLWKAQGLPGDMDRRVREILDLLSLARGPIPQADLLLLARRAPDAPAVDLDHHTLGLVWENLARLVVRRAEGGHVWMTFSHPRMQEYFAKDRLRRQNPSRYAELEGRYRDWVREGFLRVSGGEDAAADASPYVLRYAFEHLATESLEVLRGMVTRPGWYRTRYALEGDYQGYLEDVRAVWRRAVAENQKAIANRKSQIAHRQPLTAIGLEIRCALIEASLHSLAGNLPPKLPALLVENGLWSPPQALAHVRQMPDEGQKAEALEALAPVLAQKAPARLEEALAAARSIGGERHRAEALGALAPHLPPELRKQGLSEALAAARSIGNEWYRAEALGALAPHLPAGLLAEALAAARSIEDEDARTYALSSLAPHLPPELREEVLTEALAAARLIWRAAARVRTLAVLAPHLPPALREQALAKALAAARSIGGERHRAEALGALAPHLPPELREQGLSEALAAARSIGNEWYRAEALGALAPHLPAGLLAEALAAARSIRNERYRAEALASLAPHLPADLRGQALSEALALHLPADLREQALAARRRRIRYRYADARALAALAPHLPEGLREQALSEALATAQSIRDEECRARALAALAPHLPAALLEEALAAARRIWDKDAHAKALAALAPHLPAALLEEALVAARRIWDKDAHAKVLAALAPHLPPALLAQALDAARSLPEIVISGNPRAEALAALAPHLPAGLLAEALEAAQSIEWEDDRAKVLASLAPHLPPGLLSEALEAARSIRYADARAEALASLAPYLPGGLREQALSEALETARRIRDGYARAHALVSLAPHLPAGLRDQALSEALEAARSIRYADARAEALASLAPHLPEGLREQALSEALEAARCIRYADAHVRACTRAHALAALAPHLPSGLLEEALAAARSIRDERYRAEALGALAPHLPPGLRGQALSEALAAARSIRYADARAEALASLAPHLPPGLRGQALSEALAAARSIRNERYRADALASLAPHLPAELLAQTLEAAQGIGDADARAKALASLAPRLAKLPPERLYPLWAETLPMLARRTRPDLLADLRALALVLHALGGQEAVGETFRAIQDVGRWWP